MVAGRTRVLAMEYSELVNRHLCPECGGAMAEVERVSENGFSFVWYECTRTDCDGQWLQKTAAITAEHWR